MIDRTVAVPTASGPMETFITHPEQDGPFPAVVIYMDFWGLREELFDIARRVEPSAITAWCPICITGKDASATNGATKTTR